MDDELAWQLRKGPAAAQRIPRNSQVAVRALIEPFTILFEAELPRYAMPQELERVYGRLGFDSPVVYSNFVTSVDGVASLGSRHSSGSGISAKNPADRFLLGLLRATSDAVLVGAGTLRATPGHRWTAEHVYPDAAPAFARLRSKLGRKPQSRLVLLTASGDLETSHPAVVEGATILTTTQGASRLRPRLPESCDVIEIGEGHQVDMRRAIAELQKRGYEVILTEGGPHVMGELIQQDLLDEAFLTISPVVAGRDGEQRLGMVSGAQFLPDHGVWARLLSARKHEDYLFLRYGLRAR